MIAGTSGTGAPGRARPASAGRPRRGAARPRPRTLRATDDRQPERTPPARRRRPSVRGPRPGQRTARILEALDEIAARHRDVPVTMTNWQGQQEMLFGDVRLLPFALRRRGCGPAWPGGARGHSAPSWCSARCSATGGTSRPDALRGPDDARTRFAAYVARDLPAGRTARRAATGLADRRAGRTGAGAQTGKADWWRNLLLQLAGDPPGGLEPPVRRPARHVLARGRARQRPRHRRVPGRA